MYKNLLKKAHVFSSLVVRQQWQQDFLGSVTSAKVALHHSVEIQTFAEAQKNIRIKKILHTLKVKVQNDPSKNNVYCVLLLLKILLIFPPFFPVMH